MITTIKPSPWSTPLQRVTVLILLAIASTSGFVIGDDQIKKPKVYEIGVITLFDDPAGVAQINILKFVAETLNQEASKKHRPKIVFKFADGGCDPDAALQAYRGFLAQGIRAFVGGLCSDETRGFAPFLEQDHAVALNATSSSDDLEAISPNLKILSYKNSVIANTIGTQICNRHAPVAIITEADGYTENLRDLVTGVLSGCGMTPVANVTFDSQTDLVALMAGVKASGAESVFLNPVIVESGIGLLQAIEAVNWSPRPNLYGALDLIVPVVLESAPSVVPGMELAGAPPIVTSKACRILRDIETSRPGTIAAIGSYYTWTTYEAGVLLASLLVEHDGKTDKIVRALSHRTFKDDARISSVHGGNLYFGSEVFAAGVESFPFVVEPDLSISPPSCPTCH